jgi:hypothetical protein
VGSLGSDYVNSGCGLWRLAQLKKALPKGRKLHICSMAAKAEKRRTFSAVGEAYWLYGKAWKTWATKHVQLKAADLSAR